MSSPNPWASCRRRRCRRSVRRCGSHCRNGSQTPIEAFGKHLDGTAFTVEQVRFVTLIVGELTANGLMDPARLDESPFTDHAPTGPETVFGEADVDGIVAILRTVKSNAVPAGLPA